MTDDAYLHPPWAAVREAVARALAEDLSPLGDVTAALVETGLQADAHFVSRADGVLSGRRCAHAAIEAVDPSLDVDWFATDGDRLVAGERLGTVTGSLASILTAERTALNFLGHLSGVATLTARYVARAGGNARIWDTRKTTPGLRLLEKAAVRAGGGANHRGNLSEMVLLKDNHLAGIGITDAVARARRKCPARTIVVECDGVEQVAEAIAAGADLVMLDNFTPERAVEAVALANEARVTGKRFLLEASGGISLENVAAFAATGVDLISIGALTHSAPVLDIGLDITARAR